MYLNEERGRRATLTSCWPKELGRYIVIQATIPPRINDIIIERWTAGIPLASQRVPRDDVIVFRASYVARKCGIQITMKTDSRNDYEILNG